MFEYDLFFIHCKLKIHLLIRYNNLHLEKGQKLMLIISLYAHNLTETDLNFLQTFGQWNGMYEEFKTVSGNVCNVLLSIGEDGFGTKRMTSI